MGFAFFGVFEILFFVAFFLILGMILVTFIKGIGVWNKNNHSPKLTVEATVVSKREQVSHHHHNHQDIGYSTRSTTYYVTFQVESGDRMELHVNGSEFGMLVEGDYGKLTFQGTRYIGFERQR